MSVSKPGLHDGIPTSCISCKHLRHTVEVRTIRKNISVEMQLSATVACTSCE